jgi:hypothetical protein
MDWSLGGKRAAWQAPCISTEYQKTVHNVTNEALDSDPCIPVTDGYPIQYSCITDAGNTTAVAPLTVNFDYEVWIHDAGATMGILANIRALQWSILFNVAAAISLDKCKLSNQHIPRRLARREDDNLPRLRGLQNNASKVVYLASEDPGLIDLNSGMLMPSIFIPFLFHCSRLTTTIFQSRAFISRQPPIQFVSLSKG